MKTEREIFEEWFKKKYPSTSIEKQIDMEYWHERTEMSWQSWLASKNREGYKLVPVALIERCIGHIATAECHPNITHNEANQLSGDMSELNNLIEP